MKTGNTKPRDWTVWLQGQRRLAIYTLLRSILALGTVAILYTSFRVIKQQRIDFNYVYYVGSYLAIVFLYINKRLPDEIRGLALLLVLIIFGTLAFYTGWLSGSGRVFFLAAVVVGAVLVGPRAGLLSALVGLLIYIGFAFAFGTGLIHPNKLPNPLETSSMMLEGMGFTMMLAVVSAGQWLFGQALRAASEANQMAQDSRASFSNIVERSSDGIIVVDAEDIVRFVNETTCRYFEAERRDFVGKKFPFFKDPSENIELEIKLENGQKGMAEIRFTNTEWEGRPARLLMVHDITAWKQADEQVRKVNEQLEERVRERTARLEAANQELEAFSYSVSHDLRAPLRGLNGFTGILLSDFSAELSEEARHYLGNIQASADKMNTLIDELLRLSRISRADLRSEEFDLSAIAFEILQQRQAESPQRKAEIHIQTPLEVYGDQNLLRIAIENLLNNAWKFSLNKEVTEISVGAQQKEGETIVFVRDNGVGFDMQYAGKLFGAFQRLHSDQEFEGSGIGLAIVQRIIVRHAGKIWAESSPGNGTTFFFSLKASA